MAVCSQLGVKKEGALASFAMQKRPSLIAARPILFACALFYFAFHAFHGERGVFALFQNQHQLIEVEHDLQVARSERMTLEKRVSGLRVNSLDLDLLDEQARNMLGLSKENEMIMVWPDMRGAR